MVSWRPRWMKSVFRKRKPTQKGAEKVAVGISQAPPCTGGTGRAPGLTVQGQPVIPHAPGHMLAHHHLHILQGLRRQGVPKAGFLPPRQSCC